MRGGDRGRKGEKKSADGGLISGGHRASDLASFCHNSILMSLFGNPRSVAQHTNTRACAAHVACRSVRALRITSPRLSGEASVIDQMSSKSARAFEFDSQDEDKGRAG